MQNIERITRIAINQITNRQFICDVAMIILEYAASDFVKRYHCFHRAIRFFNNVCHYSIISQNFAECKHYLKKKSIQTLAANNHRQTRRGWHYKYKREQGGLPPCLFSDSLLFIYPFKSLLCGKKLKMKKYD